MKLKVVIERGKDGYYVAHCPSLPGCWSQGRTREAAKRNVREAIDLYLEPDPKQVRRSARREVIEVAV